MKTLFRIDNPLGIGFWTGFSSVTFPTMLVSSQVKNLLGGDYFAVTFLGASLLLQGVLIWKMWRAAVEVAKTHDATTVASARRELVDEILRSLKK